MRSFLLIFALLFGIQVTTMAQGKTNWRKHRDLAKEFYKAGKYEQAAENFQKAWEMKPKKTELLYQAAMSYDLIEDYQKAISALVHLTSETKDFPLAQFYYAQNLKKAGEYEAAKTNYLEFLNAYTEADKETYRQQIDRLIEGCNLALQMEEEEVETTIDIDHLPESINSPKNEFAPMPVGEDILYFSSTRRANKLKIYYSQKKQEGWTNAEQPNRLPKIWAEHYGNGTLSADGKRFYYTQCQATEQGNLRSQCDLYMIENKNDAWSTPVRLPDYINLEGVTTTHPHVILQGNTEYIFFSSDRENGLGGLDIWFITRDLDSEALDFSFPDNLGPQINTEKDEISPFYSQKEKTLYFSSNGLVSLGGFDIYKSKGFENSWSGPENVGFPLNSSANDKFFTLKNSGNSGYLVSNRPFSGSKISTTHEDIFAFELMEKEMPLLITGRIFEEGSLDMVDSASVTIYDYTEGTTGPAMAELTTEAGFFETELPSGKEYRLVANKEGIYTETEYFFNTIVTPPSGKIEMDLYMEPQIELSLDTSDMEADTNGMEEPTPSDITQVEKPALDPVEETKNPEDDEISEVTEPEVKPTPDPIMTDEQPEQSQEEVATRMEPDDEREEAVTARDNYNLEKLTGTYTYPTSYGNNYTLTSEAPRHEGTYYKVQFITLSKSLPEFPGMRDLGRVETELIEDKKWTRYLISHFYSQQEAEFALQEVQSRGYPDAFIARYEDGLRNADIYENHMLSYIKLY